VSLFLFFSSLLVLVLLVMARGMMFRAVFFFRLEEHADMWLFPEKVVSLNLEVRGMVGHVLVGVGFVVLGGLFPAGRGAGGSQVWALGPLFVLGESG
jgi:hypothetical protein